MRTRAATTAMLALGLGVAIGLWLGDRTPSGAIAPAAHDRRPGPARASLDPSTSDGSFLASGSPVPPALVAPAAGGQEGLDDDDRSTRSPGVGPLTSPPDMLVDTSAADVTAPGSSLAVGALGRPADIDPSTTVHTTAYAALPAGAAVRRDTRGRARPGFTPADPDVPTTEDDDEIVTCDRADPDAPLGPFETCLATRLGTPVWSGVVPADEPEGIRIPAPDACHYLLVVEGVFAYSATGRQDALRRWHEPLQHDFEPLCTACGADENEALIAFVIDGVARRPLAECPLSHAYIYDVTPRDGMIGVAINDYALRYDASRHDDNEGGLRLSLYTVPADHEIRMRYVARDHVLGNVVGPSLGVQRLGFEPGGTPTAMLLRFPQLATFVRQVAWPVDPARRYVVELRGFATAARGVEVDAFNRWPPLDALSRSLAISGCATTATIGLDLYAHRYAFELAGCATAVTVTSLVERLAGVIEVELFDR